MPQQPTPSASRQQLLGRVVERQRELIAGGMRVLACAYSILLALLWLGAPGATRVGRVKPRPRRPSRRTGGPLWVSTCVLSLVILYGEADKQMAIILWQLSETSKARASAIVAAVNETSSRTPGCVNAMSVGLASVRQPYRKSRRAPLSWSSALAHASTCVAF